MQFFYLFSFVVAVSYAAALPQPAELSEQYSNNVDATLASGLEARSYQPGLNSQRDSATLVSLERRGSYEEFSRDHRGSGSSPPPRLTPKDALRHISRPADKAEIGSMFLTLMVNRFGTDLGDAPENVKAAGAALDGNTGNLLVDYVQRSLQATDSLKEWVEEVGESLVTVIKSGLGDKEYSKVKPLLDDASSKLAADASYNLEQVTAALSNIANKVDSAKLEVGVVQQSFGRVFEDYKFYLETLRPHLDKFAVGQKLNEYLSTGAASLENFSLKQQDLYFTVREGILDAPSE